MEIGLVHYLTVAAVLFGLGLLRLGVRNNWLPGIPDWVSTCAEFVASRPLIPPVMAIFTGASAVDLAKRGHSRLLARLSQWPLYPAAAGVVFWLMRVDALFWPARTIICDGLFPLSMIAMIAVMIRLLLRGAGEADANWISD